MTILEGNLEEEVEKEDSKVKKIIPSFLSLLFFVSLWERFSYYGMRALLVLYLTSHLGFVDTKAYAIYSVFAAIGYAVPVLSGILADKFLGFRSLVIIGSIVITIGHVSMFLSSFDSEFIFLGLALIAVGTGLFKGNATSLLGACYKNNDPERSRGFTLFYVGVNLGAFSASILCGYIAAIYGWEYGFSLAGFGMVLGLVAFIRYQFVLGNVGLAPMKISKSIYIFVFISSLLLSVLVSQMIKYSEYSGNFLQYFAAFIFAVFSVIVMRQKKEDRIRLIALSVFLLFTMLFFALEMQLGSLINLFSSRNVDGNIFGFKIPAAVSQSINPFSIIIFGLLISRFLNVSSKYDIHKFAFGLFTMAICFAILYLGCVNADINGQVGYAYLFIGLAFMSLGEIFIGPIIQAQASLLAPKHMKGLVMGLVMLALAMSNLAGMVISEFMSVPSVNGEVNALESLEIYKLGFEKIAKINVLFTIIFLTFYRFLNKVISKA